MAFNSGYVRTTTDGVPPATSLVATYDFRKEWIEFLKAVATGMTVQGAAQAAGLADKEATRALGHPRAQRIIKNYINRIDRLCRLSENPPRDSGVNSTYLLVRLKAIEADPTTQAKDRVQAIRCMAEMIGWIRKAAKHPRIMSAQTQSMSDATLERIAKSKAGDDGNNEGDNDERERGEGDPEGFATPDLDS